MGWLVFLDLCVRKLGSIYFLIESKWTTKTKGTQKYFSFKVRLWKTMNFNQILMLYIYNIFTIWTSTITPAQKKYIHNISSFNHYIQYNNQTCITLFYSTLFGLSGISWVFRPLICNSNHWRRSFNTSKVWFRC